MKTKTLRSHHFLSLVIVIFCGIQHFCHDTMSNGFSKEKRTAPSSVSSLYVYNKINVKSKATEYQNTTNIYSS